MNTEASVGGVNAPNALAKDGHVAVPAPPTDSPSGKRPYRTPGDHDSTPPLDAFLDAYGRDDNEWWRLSGGHHMNLFDEAIERIALLESIVVFADGLAENRAGFGLADLYASDSRQHIEIRRVLAAASESDPSGTG